MFCLFYKKKPFSVKTDVIKIIQDYKLSGSSKEVDHYDAVANEHEM